MAEQQSEHNVVSSSELEFTRPPLSTWQVETLRLTAFPSPTAQVAELAWWTELVGEPPETRISRPRMGGQQEEGSYRGGKLLLRVRPERIDWLFTTVHEEEGEVEAFPTIGAFPETVNIFLPLMRRWFDFDTCPPAQRLAFGAVLLQPVEDRSTGYQQLSRYLPHVEVDPEGSSDFLYQINRRRESTSGINGLEINRLSKWSVATWRPARLSVGPAGIGYSKGQEHFACRLELDINTVPNLQEELTREQMPQVLEELVGLGREIAREGDIP
jgi:hypothetical protein